MTINKNKSVICILLSCLVLTFAFCALQNVAVFAEEIDTPVVTQYTVTFYSQLDEEFVEEKEMSINAGGVISCPDFSSDFSDINFYEIIDIGNKSISEIEFDFNSTVENDINILIDGELKSYSLTTYSYQNNEKVLKDTTSKPRFILFTACDNYNYYFYNQESQTIGSRVEDNHEYREDLVVIEVPEYKCTFKYTNVEEETQQEYIAYFDCQNPLDLSYMGSLPSYKKFIGWTTVENDYKTLVDSGEFDSDIVLYEYTERLFIVTVKEKVGESENIVDLNLSESQQNGITTSELKVILDEKANAGHYYDLYYLNGNNKESIFDGQKVVKKLENLSLELTDNIDSIDLIIEDKYISYTITYMDMFNATLESKAYSYNIDSSVEIKTPERIGYRFDGWVIDGVVYQSYTITRGSTGNIEARATWTPNQYIVTISNNGQSDSKTILYDSKLEFLADYNTSSKLGYTFKYWQVNVIDKPTVDINTIYRWTDNIEIIAVYDPKVYRITYDCANDTENKFSEVAFDSKIELINNPTKTGYSFVGWYYENQPFTAEYFVYSKDIQLTAAWKANTYTVIIEFAEKKDTIDCVYDSSCRITIPEDVKSDAIVGYVYLNGGVITPLANKDGYIDKWNIANNMHIMAYYICSDSYVGKVDINEKIVSSIDKDYKVSIDDKIIATNYVSDEIGYHIVKIKDKDNKEVVNYTYLVTPDWNLSTETYNKPVVLNRINAKVSIDGKEIDSSKDYRIDKNGTHTIVITGTNGYTQEYTIVYSNPNITYFWYILAVAIVLAIPAIVLLIMGRRHMIVYGMDRE